MALVHPATWRLRPERTFLTLGLLGGLTLVFLNPPLQGPDEGAHLRRAYQLSLGRVLALREGGYAGDILPASLHGQAMRAVGRLCRHPERRLTWDAFREVLALPLAPEQTAFAEFRNTAVYSPIPYLPQSLALVPARLVEVRPLFLLYLGRLAGLASWLTLVLVAIRVIPFGRWLLAAVALSPVAIVQGSVLSADSITIGLGFLTLALGLRLATRDDTLPFAAREIRWFTATAAALALCKFVYATLALLVLAMPRPRAEPWRRHVAVVMAALALVGVAWGSWSAVASRLWLDTRLAENASLSSAADLRPDPTSAPTLRLGDLLRNPAPYLALMARTIAHHRPWMLAVSSIDWGVSLPTAPAMAVLLLLAAIAVMDGSDRPSLRHPTRALLILASLAAMLGPYVVHCALGADPDAPYIEAVHGRYWIPVAPALLLGLSSGRFAAARPMLPWLAVGSALLSLGLTDWALLQRYYLP